MKIVKITTNQETKAVDLTASIIKKGYSPYINETTGTWMVYDDYSKTWVDYYTDRDFGVYLVWYAIYVE